MNVLHWLLGSPLGLALLAIIFLLIVAVGGWVVGAWYLEPNSETESASPTDWWIASGHWTQF